MEKCLEFVSYDQDKVIYILLTIVLLQTKSDLVLEERHGKRNLVSFSSSSGSKLVLTLLTEVVALYIGLSAIYIWGTGFQKFIPRLFGGGGSLGFQNNFKNPLHVIFSILRDKRYNGKDDSNRKICP